MWTMFKSHEFCTHPRYFGMRRYESKLISQGKLSLSVYDQYLTQWMLYSSQIFWYAKSHEFCIHPRYFGMNSVFIPDILVCVGMSQKSFYTPSQVETWYALVRMQIQWMLYSFQIFWYAKSHEFCTHPRYFSMRRYESKIILHAKAK